MNIVSIFSNCHRYLFCCLDPSFDILIVGQMTHHFSLVKNINVQRDFVCALFANSYMLSLSFSLSHTHTDSYTPSAFRVMVYISLKAVGMQEVPYYPY